MTDTRPYRPSNGTEGEGFMSCWCMECERDKAFWDQTGEGCEIAARALIYNVGDPEYPTEWVEDDKDGPRCTAFVEISKPVPTELEQEAAGQLNALEGL